jgi:hypothetical protein
MTWSASRTAATLVIALLVLAPGANADEILLFGQVGNGPIAMALERDGTKLDGWYFYTREAKEIEVSGKLSGAAFELSETIEGRVAATFKGSIARTAWSGSWQKIGAGNALGFSLTENRDPLSDLNAQINCTAKSFDRQFSMTTTHELTLRVAKGKVATLSMTHSERSFDGDEQTCSIGSDDLASRPSAVGILLRSKEDTKEGPDAQHCSLRIAGTDRYLYVRVGDTREANNDCRAAGDTQYCSARGSWADMIVDRKSGQCKSVE